MRFPWPPFRGSAVGANSSVVGRLSRVNLLGDYFKTIEGKECKNVTVWRVGHPTAPSVAHASAADATSELSTGGGSSGPAQCEAGTPFIVAAAQLRREKNHEKNAVDYCLGGDGIVCVGTDHAAAAYEDARGAAAAAANHNHRDHYY